MGALQWDPDGSNLRDLNGARESYARSATLLEAQVAANPSDAALRHQLTLAYLRHAQLLDSDREQRAGFEHALQSARKLAAAQPANLQAKDDLAEVYPRAAGIRARGGPSQADRSGRIRNRPRRDGSCTRRKASWPARSSGRKTIRRWRS